MNGLAGSLIAASLALALLPTVVVAQCEGGTTVAGFYLRDGSYVPGHCATTNPTTPGQLFPSGAQPVPSTNPAAGASRLPGQLFPASPLPVTSTDLGPAPAFVNTGSLAGGGLPAGGSLPAAGPNLGPGASFPGQMELFGPATNLGVGTGSATPAQLGTGAAGLAAAGLLPGQAIPMSVAPGTDASAAAALGLPAQFPQTGLATTTANSAIPSTLAFPNQAGLTGVLGLNPRTVAGAASQGANLAALTATGQLPALSGLSPRGDSAQAAVVSGPIYVGEEINQIVVTGP